MNTAPAAALARTLLLMRDELSPSVQDEQLHDALKSTGVALVADQANVSSHSAQSAYVTAAMLMARSGQRVHLLAPDVRLLDKQAPLRGDRLISALVAASNNMMPGVAFTAAAPTAMVDLEVRFGDSPSKVVSRRSIALCASAWAGGIAERGARWPDLEWPLGGLAAAALAAGEAFKASMMRLESFALNPESFRARFAPYARGNVELAPADTPNISDFGLFDVISGGAIANGFLYCLSRVRRATGRGQVVDFDVGDITNLNRNMLMLYSDVKARKVDVLASRFPDGVILEPVACRFDDAARRLIAPTSRILVGVDHIPTRWIAQACDPAWLGVGATSHWSSMASYHVPGVACARCLHPEDDPSDAPIPTVAFVSFWAGLLLASYFIQGLGSRHGAWPQHTYLTPLRPEVPWRTPVATRPSCPFCSLRTAARAGHVTTAALRRRRPLVAAQRGRGSP